MGLQHECADGNCAICKAKQADIEREKRRGSPLDRAFVKLLEDSGATFVDVTPKMDRADATFLDRVANDRPETITSSKRADNLRRSGIYTRPTASPTVLIINAPIKTVSEMNQREHFMAKHSRKKQQQKVLAGYLVQFRPETMTPPLRITMTRIGPRKLDDDNLAGAFKHVQDALAKWLQIDDGDTSKVKWVRDQRKGAPKECAVEIRVEAAE